MSVVKVQGNASGTGIFTVAAPATNTDRTLTLPDQTGTILSNAGPFTANASASNGAVTIDASNNVGIGTSSPRNFTGYGALTINGTSGGILSLNQNGTEIGRISGDGNFAFFSQGTQPILFGNSGGERARIDSSGNLLVGTTSNTRSGRLAVFSNASGGSNPVVSLYMSTTANAQQMTFDNGNGQVGSINTSGTATSYLTSSDYRLKHDIAPMTGALAKVAALKPVTYKWNADDSSGEGFIAHELAEVCPHAVAGEKDAVDAEGKPVYQGIDTSFLVATLTAAIQEQQAIIESLTARITALEAK